MLIILLLAAILASCTILLVHYSHTYRSDTLALFITISFTISLAVFLILLIILATTYITLPGTIDAALTERAALVYQLDNHLYENDNPNDTSLYLLYQDITAFNTKFAAGLKYSQNPWINWFFPKSLYSIPLIPITAN